MVSRMVLVLGFVSATSFKVSLISYVLILDIN